MPGSHTINLFETGKPLAMANTSLQPARLSEHSYISFEPRLIYHKNNQQ